MTAIATTMETQICKIALRKLTQRLAVSRVQFFAPNLVKLRNLFII